MPDYKKMYAILCSAASEAIDLLPPVPENLAATARLQMALLEAEELYLQEEE